jgi:hypothetical protein
MVDLLQALPLAAALGVLAYFAAGVGLHHHGVKSFVDPAAWLEPIGKEAALPQFWDGQADVAYLGGE